MSCLQVSKEVAPCIERCLEHCVSLRRLSIQTSSNLSPVFCKALLRGAMTCNNLQDLELLGINFGELHIRYMHHTCRSVFAHLFLSNNMQWTLTSITDVYTYVHMYESVRTCVRVVTVVHTYVSGLLYVHVYLTLIPMNHS